MKKTITLEPSKTLEILGPQNANLIRVCGDYPALKVVARGNEIKLEGDKEDIDRFTEDLHQILVQRQVQESGKVSGVVVYSVDGKAIAPRGKAQKAMVEAYNHNDLIFATGPAGSGKTYMAIALAVRALKNREIRRIILTRPAVEAGERLGFLPGDLQSKVDPYLRPLYDALFDMLGAETYNKYLERGNIEVAPLAYMRGRTLDDSFIILDEAQNTSREQMKMFLTRIGFGSKVVITGDVTQIDLPGDKQSGLKEAMRVLRDIEDIKICRLTGEDVVRHVLVQRIIEAYEAEDKRRVSAGPKPNAPKPAQKTFKRKS